MWVAIVFSYFFVEGSKRWVKRELALVKYVEMKLSADVMQKKLCFFRMRWPSFVKMDNEILEKVCERCHCEFLKIVCS